MSLPAASTLATLRRRLASLEAANLAFPRARPDREDPLRCCGDRGLTDFARQKVERRNGQGGEPGGLGRSTLALAALNEIAAARESEIAAATGFVLPLAAWAAAHRTTVWIAEDMALAENGAPYGPALDDFGLAPERLVRIAVAHAREVSWAMEEALRCRAVGAVIGEMRGGEVGLTASRRLSLAAGRDGATAFLLRAMPAPESLAAATRWVIGAAPSAHGYGPGPPRLSVQLTRNRRGETGSWLLEWNSVGQRFDIAAADRQPVAEAAVDRPPRAAWGA